MKMITFPKFKNYTNQIVRYIQPKFDGHLAKIYVENNIAKIFSKNNKDITEKVFSINHLRKELDCIPNNSIVWGELHCSKRFSTDIPTMLNDSDSDLRLTAFAAPLFNGYGYDYAMDLIEIMSWLQNCGLEISCTQLIHPRSAISPHWQKELLEEARKVKLEGWVLKEGHLYGWYKLKPTKTIDAFVIGTFRSFSATHYNGLQSVRIAVWNGVKIHDLGQIGSGFKLEYRKQFDTHAKRANLLDKVCEVKFDSVAANGKLRFPRFVRWRDDKNKDDCTMEQLKCK